MSATLAPYGFIPLSHPSGQNRAMNYPIQNNAGTGYTTSIFKGDTVILNTAGYVTIGTAAADLLGVFQGCEYTEASGKPTVSNFWPASTLLQTNSTPIAWVLDDVNTIYRVQNSTGASYAVSAIGDQADIDTSVAGSTITGISGQGVGALKGAGVQGQFRILDLYHSLTNNWGDTYVEVEVQLARSQYITAKVAI